jgi:hypothetical protein
VEEIERPEGQRTAPREDSGTGQQSVGGGEGPSAKEATDLAAVVSGFAGALTAAAALVVVPGGAALLARLGHADLPTDVGVVVSLPPEFLLATGLTYLLFPLIAVVGLTLAVVLIPGRGGMANPALLPRPAPSETPSGSPDNEAGGDRGPVFVQALRWRFSHGGWLIVLFVALTVPALMLAEDLSPHPLLALAALVIVGGLLFTLSRVLVGRRVDNLASIALTAVVAAAFFLPGAMLFAASRDFPAGSVCVGAAHRVDGVLIGEADGRVYVGEAEIWVALFIAGRSRPRDARTTLREADWDVRRPESPRVVGLERLDLVVADITAVETEPASEGDESSVVASQAAERESRALDEKELERVLDEQVPIYAMTNNDRVAKAATARGVDRVVGESAATHDDLALFAREVLDAEAEEQAELEQHERRAQPERRILSIPSTKVDRIMIGGEGSCPGEAGSS